MAGLARWPRVRRVLTRARELCPLTLRGALVLCAAVAALYVYGFGELDGVWYVAGLGLCVLCGLSLLWVLAAALRLGLWLRAQGAPEPRPLAVDTGRELDSHFVLPRLRFWLFVEVRVSWLEPTHVTARLAPDRAFGRERVRFDDHGERRTVQRLIELRDVFGLASLSLRQRAPIAIDVLPQRGALLSLAPLQSLSGGDDVPHPLGVAHGDRLELKRYAPGDPARFIHWKVYARTQKLVVRMPERALSRAYRVAAFLAAGAGDGATAAVARVALEQGALGADFRFAAAGSPTPVSRVDQGLVALRRSADHRADGAADLGSFVSEVEKEGPAALVVFAPAHAPQVEARVAALLRERARPLRVVIGVDGVTRDPPPSWLERVTLAAQSSSRTALAALQDSVTFYKKLGCEVLIVDRDSGRLLGDAHLAHVAKAGRRQGVAA
ncbi:MAG TPA: DUF58 domain-containing protein [Polyangiales bacterium]